VNAPAIDLHAYYRQVTDIDIGEIARELLASRITQESQRTLFCDCPNHQSQSHRSLQVSLEEQCWCCWGCGVGGDVLQFVEFVRHGVVTRGQSGRMPESHRAARDFLAARVGLPPLSKLASPEHAEESYRSSLRVRESLTAAAEAYHQRLMANAEVFGWFRSKYGIGEETIVRLKIGFADTGEPSVARVLMDGPGAFTMRDLTATSVFRPTAQDGVVPFFDGRIVFPYWSRGRVVFMIGRQTPWTPDHEWEKSKYKKLAVRNGRNNEHVAECIRNDVLYNEDVLLTRPERVIITEGVTDCISLMEHGFPVVSPVTVQIREADWERLLPKLAGVKTVFICQDNEISEAGMQGALKTARTLADHGITTRVAVLPLGEKQRAAREKLAELGAGAAGADELLADAKIDVNEFFAAGNTATDFEAILDTAQTPLELAISRLTAETPDGGLSRSLEPILAEVGQLDPLEQERHFRLIQARCGKLRVPVTTLRRQLKVVEIARPRRSSRSGASAGMRGGAAAVPAGESGPEPLRRIQVNNRQLRDVIADAWVAVHALNDSPDGASGRPFVFQKGGTLVRIAGEGGSSRIEPLCETAVYGMLARCANWHKVTEEAVLAAPPSKDAARDMLVNPDFAVPPLESVMRTPAFGSDGNLISTPGYHRGDAAWLFLDAALNVPPVPSRPTGEQIAQAKALLVDELLLDFPFVRESDRAHALAAILLPFVERMIGALAPIHLIEAPTQGSGKGLLASLIGIITTGAAPEGRTLPEAEDDVRKMITAELITGRPIILLDNLNEKRKLDSSALASVVTQSTWTDRILGVSRMLDLKNHALWMMTGNNPQLSDEMSRRCIRIRIDPRIDMPWLRDGFKHPVLGEWAMANRSALVHAALTLIQAWVAAGRPLYTRRLGSFEKWSEVMGGILEVAGIPGFLGNLNELYAAADTDGQMWREFTGAWWEVYREQPKRVSELNQLCEDRDLMATVRGDGGPRSQHTRLGKALGVKRDRVFNGLTVKRLSEGNHKTGVLYALVLADGDKPGQYRPPNLSLLDSLGGDVARDGGDVVETLADRRLHQLGPIESAEYSDGGDVGDGGDVPANSRARETHAGREYMERKESACEESEEPIAGSGQNVPHVSTASATNTKSNNLTVETFGCERLHQVPTTSPRRPHGESCGAIDLADLPVPTVGSGKDPP
jgi:DNA primase